MQSQATTVEQYLKELPADRRAELERVRAVVRENLDGVIEEGMQYGMIGWFIPHRVFPAGYHCDPKQPLPYAGLASQKNHLSLYLMCIYGENPVSQWFQEAWKASGKKLDMGKACIRFKKADDLALDVIAELIRKVPAAKYIEVYQQALDNRPTKAAAKKRSTQPKAAVRKPSKKRSPTTKKKAVSKKK